MAVTVKVIREQNPTHDTTGSSDFATAIDDAIGGTITSAQTAMTSCWDTSTNSIVVVLALNTN
jgi:hypothetical protein|tara:strand:+ start:735 stop:923 length:189 start_codon:yes stop_codon:yes gene_type:complete